MAKKAFVSLTGGLNNVDRPDTLEEDQLQECVNYEIRGVGRLEKRTDPSEFNAELTTILDAHFSEIIFVSEPYYPPNKMQGDFEDYMLFVFGLTDDGYKLEVVIPTTATVSVWTIQNEVTEASYLQDLYDAGLVYTEESNIDISVGDRNVYINDGVNPIHKVSITQGESLLRHMQA